MSFIINFKEIATKDEILTKSNLYRISYISNNYLITDNGYLYIDTNTSLLKINFPFVSYTYDINKDFAVIVPIIKALQLQT